MKLQLTNDTVITLRINEAENEFTYLFQRDIRDDKLYHIFLLPGSSYIASCSTDTKRFRACKRYRERDNVAACPPELRVVRYFCNNFDKVPENLLIKLEVLT